MRTLLAMLLLGMAGCDTLWAPYIEDFAKTKGQGNGEAFPGSLETSYALNRPYVLMATGNYDGDSDGVADVAVSGLFQGTSINANTAYTAPVEIYTGDGQGGLKPDGTCLSTPMERVVYLLTVPTPGQPDRNDLLIATEDSKLYRCSKSAGTWATNEVDTAGGIFNGFKQLALAHQEPPGSEPDLIVRIGINRFTDRSSTTGSLQVYRANSPLSFGAARITVSPGDINWVLPYRVGAASGDSLALTWDNPPVHPGVDFYYVPQNNVYSDQGSGQTAAADVPGTGLPELKNVSYSALASLHSISQGDKAARTSILVARTQDKNSLSVLYGDAIESFGVQAQQTDKLPDGFMLPYAGDADGDANDEIVVYTTSPNAKPLVRHLLILSYKLDAINLMNPIADITNSTENFRAVALEYLGDNNDSRRKQQRKDLIALVEDPLNGRSRLIVRRSNLQYRFP